MPVRRSAAIRFCPVSACARQYVGGTVRSGSNQAQILYRKHTVLQFVEYRRCLCKNKPPPHKPTGSMEGALLFLFRFVSPLLMAVGQGSLFGLVLSEVIVDPVP